MVFALIVSIHAPARGATSIFFYINFCFFVSIHAPARGATFHSRQTNPFCEVSIHAPARGATCLKIAIYTSKWTFQSTLPRGERLFCPCPVLTFSVFQSTLPRGERQPRSRRVGGSICFNPRSREGSDHSPVCKTTHRLCFNPRSREGSDYLCVQEVYIIPCFNPRSREGSDLAVNQPKTAQIVFQSTLPRGERLTLVSFTSLVDVSIHAPARGATTFTINRQYIILCFNPRSREGSDSPANHFKTSICVSIHAPARGATNLISFYFPSTLFQSTLPRGERRSLRCPERLFHRVSIHAPARGAT